MEAPIFYAKIREGDATAFEWLYKQYHPKAYAFCKSILHDADKAKDVVQESFTILWEHRTRITADEAVHAYLFRIIRNACLKQLRRDAIQNNFSNIDSVTLSELELGHYTEEQNILNDIYFNDLHEHYHEALDRLPKQCRTIFYMNRNHGMRSKEIAGALNLSVRTVENQLYRGLKLMKKSLRDYLPLCLWCFIGLHGPQF